MTPDKRLEAAIKQNDYGGVRRALESGADVNRSLCDGEESPLTLALRQADYSLYPARDAVARLLIEHGADVDFRGRDNLGVVYMAALTQDPQIVEHVLSRGADPNLVLEDGDSIYDSAEFRYRYYAFNLMPTLPYTEADGASEDAWLDYLERAAEHEGVGRPDFLRVLRKYGAKTASELRRRSAP